MYIYRELTATSNYHMVYFGLSLTHSKHFSLQEQFSDINPSLSVGNVLPPQGMDSFPVNTSDTTHQLHGTAEMTLHTTNTTHKRPESVETTSHIPEPGHRDRDLERPSALLKCTNYNDLQSENLR